MGKRVRLPLDGSFEEDVSSDCPKGLRQNHAPHGGFDSRRISFKLKIFLLFS
jgi:hypothetical protein